MKIKFWVHVKYMNSGSFEVGFFKTHKDAYDDYDKDMEKYGENYCGDIVSHEFEVDKFGQVLNGFDFNNLFPNKG